MTKKPTEEFKRDAIRIALTSGLPRKQVAEDLGVGHSTLNRWVKAFGEAGTVPSTEAELANEIERLRRELRIVTDLSRTRRGSEGSFPRRKWETLKKATVFFAGQTR